MGPVRVSFFGCAIDLLTLKEALSLAIKAIETRQRFQHSDINITKLVSARSDPELMHSIVASDIVCPDGMGIVWAGRAYGIPIRERVAGIDFMTTLIELAAERGYRCYFLGAHEDTLERAITRLRQHYPKLQIAGSRNGYFGPQEEELIVEIINQSRADCLFVGMPSPKKESFLYRNRDRIRVPVQIGVGGAFDVVAGEVQRAPIWAQRAGLEWLFRLAQEPRRLAWRYAHGAVIFSGMLLRDMAGRCFELLSKRTAA
jgi:N-acetylglucosaminyldiphosphoundecaprenol N-acetyl-beta-D-mannosaminyltransferase